MVSGQDRRHKPKRPKMTRAAREAATSWLVSMFERCEVELGPRPDSGPLADVWDDLLDEWLLSHDRRGYERHGPAIAGMAALDEVIARLEAEGVIEATNKPGV